MLWSLQKCACQSQQLAGWLRLERHGYFEAGGFGGIEHQGSPRHRAHTARDGADPGRSAGGRFEIDVSDDLAVRQAVDAYSRVSWKRVFVLLILSIKAAANSVGVDPGTWSNWERGKTILYRKHLNRLAQLLELPADTFDQKMASRFKVGCI